MVHANSTSPDAVWGTGCTIEEFIKADFGRLLGTEGHKPLGKNMLGKILTWMRPYAQLYIDEDNFDPKIFAAFPWWAFSLKRAFTSKTGRCGTGQCRRR